MSNLSDAVDDDTRQTNPAHRKEALINAAREWGYFTGGLKSRTSLWKGRSILDVGMGGGPHSVSFAEGGCKVYVGVDPWLGTDHVRDARSKKDNAIPSYHRFPFSIAEISEIYPNVHLYPGLLEDVQDKVRAHSIDFAMMAAVTEHLRHPHDVIRGIWEVLSKDGLLWFSHCNYYSWSGHHQQPRSVAQWNKDNPKHAEFADWKHLEPNSPIYSNTNFNRVRLQDLRDLVNKYFEIVEWRIAVDALPRLTPEIRKKWRKYTLSELLGQMVYVIARRRDVPLDVDLSTRQFYHPDEGYLASADHSEESLDEIKKFNFVYFTPKGEICSHSNNDFAGNRVLNEIEPGTKIKLSKFPDVLELTVAKIIKLPRGEVRAEVVEKLPADLKIHNRDSWTIIPNG